MSNIFKSTKQRKEAARKRINDREDERGNNEEYISELLKTYHKYSDTRERANNENN